MSSRATIVQRVVTQLHTLLPDVRITRVRPLALLVCGLLWAETVSLPRIAAELPEPATDPSRERRLRRWLANPHVAVRSIWQALLPTLLASLSGRHLHLVFDPTPFTTRATILLLGLVHGHRILPLAWRIVPQQDGPWEPSQTAIMRELMGEVADAVPPDCTVTLVVDRQIGDRAFSMSAGPWAGMWSRGSRRRGASRCTGAPARPPHPSRFGT